MAFRSQTNDFDPTIKVSTIIFHHQKSVASKEIYVDEFNPFLKAKQKNGCSPESFWNVALFEVHSNWWTVC